MSLISSRRVSSILAAAVATVPAVTFAADVTNGSDTPVTISLSGSTAMRNFTTSASFSYLAAGSNITLNSGTGGAPVTYYADSSSSGVQLAYKSGAITANPTTNTPVTNANYFALRLEWHEQGSVEGINDMVNDQIGYIGATPVSDPAFRNAGTGTLTPIWVNQNSFTAAGTINGHTLANSSYNTYDTSVTTGYTSTGKNNAGGMNRVQMAISDVAARQGYSIAGTSSVSNTAGNAGYGKGNPALLGSSRAALVDSGALNMPTNKVNPATGANYAAGPWNSGGINNLQNKTVAITATLPVANPGTGLARINRTDAQWLSTTGRLANGADFNSVTRDVNSGTRNVFDLNTGIDVSYGVGENDGGVSGGGAQDAIGSSMKFSGKTSGGSALRPTVQNNRMAFGHLSLSDSRGGGANNGNRPIRALDYRDDADDLNNGSNGYGDPSVSSSTATVGSVTYDVSRSGFSPVNAYNISYGNYVIWQNETYVTVKAPNAAYAGDSASQWAARTDTETGIKGDNSGNDVADVRNNILSSITNFPGLSIANPADGLINTSFILPSFMHVTKTQDGINQATTPNASENTTLRDAFLGSASLSASFSMANPTAVTSGTGSTYGNVTPTQGAISITANNYLFGDFDQDGDRDAADAKLAIQAQANLAVVGNDMFAGVANSTAVSTSGLAAGLAAISPTKGDLIVKGDFNGDGKFDGRDLYLMGRGSSLADNTSTDNLTAASGTDFADRIRKGVLRKNATLEYLQTNATATQKTEASVDGGLAFEHRDVNRDGKVDFYDAAIVDGFNGKSISNMSDQLNAVVATNALAKGTTFVGTGNTTDPTADQTTARSAISLVDVEQNDDLAINQSDVTSINSQLTGAGVDTWTAGNSYKTGANTITFNRSSSTVTLGAGAKLNILAGTVENKGADVFTNGSSSIDIDTASPATFKVSSGSHTTVSHITGTGTTTATGSGSVLAARFGIKQGTLTVASGAQFAVAANGGTTGVSKVNALSIDSTSKLELHDNDLVIDYTGGSSSYTSTVNSVKSGLVLLGGTGNGIASAEVDAQTVQGTILAVVDDGDANISGAITATSGYAIPNPASSVIVKFTWFGDSNLDGSVDGSDYALLDSGFTSGGALSGWVFGDYDYSGTVDGSDYALIDTGFISQNAVLPEPTTLGLLGLGAMGMLRRRRSAR